MVMTDELIEFLGELFVEKNIREETGYTFIQFVESFKTSR